MSAGTYLFIGPGGSIYYGDPVATFAALPPAAPVGTVRLTLDTFSLFSWNGSSWVAVGGAEFISSILDTNSEDLTVLAGTLSANLILSSNAAGAGNFNVTNVIESTGSVGLHSQLPIATTLLTGVISSTDWNTFNSKVSTARAINTTAPITGGGDLSADRTIAMAKSTTLVDGYLAAADFTIFNNKVATTRAVNTSAPITGGGNLSADRTIAIAQSSTSIDGYLAATDFTTFNNKVSTTRAINTTGPLSGGGNLSADRTLSISLANTTTDGYLSSTDWNTFNGKQAFITAATTADFYRGDKTFQTLQMSALTATVAGTAAASGKIGEILSATQSSATGTGVGSTGVYGAATSLSLTAGSWRVYGVAAFHENSAVLTTSLSAGISSTANGSGLGAFDVGIINSLSTGANDCQFPTPAVYFDVAGSTTIYLNTRFYYSSGSPQHYGKIVAERVR